MAIGPKQPNIKTPEFRLSYPAITRPDAVEGGEPKYGITMLFDKRDAQNPRFLAMKKQVDDILNSKEFKAKYPKGVPSTFKMPFRDGDTEKPGVDGYSGVIFVAARNATRPPTYLRDNSLTMEGETFYAGCYCVALVHAYDYDKGGGRGIAFSFDGIKFMRDGQPFSGLSEEAVAAMLADDGDDLLN